MIRLNLCPFCESKSVEIVDSMEPGEYGQLYAYCNDCGARGSLGDTKREAADKWNKRADDKRRNH